MNENWIVIWWEFRNNKIVPRKQEFSNRKDAVTFALSLQEEVLVLNLPSGSVINTSQLVKLL